MLPIALSLFSLIGGDAYVDLSLAAQTRGDLVRPTFVNPSQSPINAFINPAVTVAFGEGRRDADDTISYNSQLSLQPKQGGGHALNASHTLSTKGLREREDNTLQWEFRSTLGQINTSNAAQTFQLFGGAIPEGQRNLYFLNVHGSVPVTWAFRRRESFRLISNLDVSDQLSNRAIRRIQTQIAPSIDARYRLSLGRHDVLDTGNLFGVQLFPGLVNYVQMVPSVRWEHAFGPRATMALESGVAMVMGIVTAGDAKPKVSFVPTAVAEVDFILVRSRSSGLTLGFDAAIRPFFSPLAGTMTARLNASTNLVWNIVERLSWSALGGVLLPLDLPWERTPLTTGLGLSGTTIVSWGVTDFLAFTATGQITTNERYTQVAPEPGLAPVQTKITDHYVSVLLGFVFSWGFAT